MKDNKLIFTRLILVMTVAIALLAANLQGFSLANASDMSEDDLATTRQLTMVYKSPVAGSWVETVLMPATEVRLAGRSADGKWLALEAGWIQRSDVSTNSDLVALPVIRVAQTFSATTRQLTMVYKSPEAGSWVETVLMPATKVSLVGRSADGKWLALGAGWIQRSDVSTNSDLVALPVIRVAQTFSATTRQLTMVYKSPVAGSWVETVLMPATEVRLVGRSADGKWLILGAGWIQRSDVSTNSDLVALPVIRVAQTFSATTRQLTMVYKSPEAGSWVETVLMPATKVSLVGRSADGKWLALGAGWIQRSDVSTNSDLVALLVIRLAQTFSATTRYLTMVYESPEAGSRVETVLMPATEVSLVGRSADGKWLALGAGWIQRSDVRTDGNLASLPILNVAAAMDVIAGQ
jgi:uncharacterized membrane protein